MIALAAVRATREALVRGEGGGLPSIVGTAVPGEWTDGRHFDGTTEMAFFPGDLPAEDCRRRRFPLDPVPAAGAGGDRRRHSGAAAHSPRPRAAIPDRGPAAMTETLRKPAIFSVDDPRLVVAEPDEAQRPTVDAIAEAPADNLPAVRRAPAGAACLGARCSGRRCPASC